MIPFVVSRVFAQDLRVESRFLDASSSLFSVV